VSPERAGRRRCVAALLDRAEDPFPSGGEGPGIGHRGRGRDRVEDSADRLDPLPAQGTRLDVVASLRPLRFPFGERDERVLARMAVLFPVRRLVHSVGVSCPVGVLCTISWRSFVIAWWNDTRALFVVVPRISAIST